LSTDFTAGRLNFSKVASRIVESHTSLGKDRRVALGGATSD
jgi:hypothetical protein